MQNHCKIILFFNFSFQSASGPVARSELIGGYGPLADQSEHLIQLDTGPEKKETILNLKKNQHFIAKVQKTRESNWDFTIRVDII